MFLAPTLLYALIAEQQRQPRNTRGLHSITYGAAPMPVEKIRQAQAVFGNKIDVTYGQTEASQCLTGATREELADEQVMSVRSDGRGRWSRWRRWIRRVASCRPARQARWSARGDLLMKGYLDNPEQTAQTIVDGWLHTGDIGSFDEQGFLTIRGRLKDMIISGGFNVYPTDVEGALSKHPGVHESVVFGMSDEKWGERVEAAVRLRDGARVDAAEPDPVRQGRDRLRPGTEDRPHRRRPAAQRGRQGGAPRGQGTVPAGRPRGSAAGRRP